MFDVEKLQILKGHHFGRQERRLLSEAIKAAGVPQRVMPAGHGATSFGWARRKAAVRLAKLGLLEICRHRKRRCFILTDLGEAFARRFVGRLLYGGDIAASRFVRALERDQQRAVA